MAVPYSSDDARLPQALPIAPDNPTPMRRKIARFENNLLATYVEHQIHSDNIKRALPTPIGPNPGFYSTKIACYDDCTGDIQKRALKGQLKTKQELEDERQKKARWWEENDSFWRVYTSRHDEEDVTAAKDAAHPGDAELRVGRPRCSRQQEIN